MSDRDVYAMPQVSQADFPELLKLMRPEGAFPDTYPEWQALWARRRREEVQRGYRVIFVDIQPARFAQYCKEFSPPLPPSWGALAKYVESMGMGLA